MKYMIGCIAGAAACIASAAAAPTQSTFGTVLSSAVITNDEQTVFEHQVQPEVGGWGVITHWWITGGEATDNCLVRFYVDNETDASIALEPSLAVGTGFDDNSLAPNGPWGSKWIGRGSNKGAWFSNIRIPFGSSVRVTIQLNPERHDLDTAVYIIIRGAEGLPISFNGVNVQVADGPGGGARLKLIKSTQTVGALADVTFINITDHSGVVFGWTQVVNTTSMNMLEGCFHMFADGASWPGVTLSSGTEDLYDSSYYFAAGPFQQPVSGMTHLTDTNGTVEFSAYRFFDMDPLFFSKSISIMTRNGDVVDPKTGHKCFIENVKDGLPVGSPKEATFTFYAWVYVYPTP